METSTKFLLGAKVAPTLVWPGRWWFCWEGHGLALSCWVPPGRERPPGLARGAPRA